MTKRLVEPEQLQSLVSPYILGGRQTETFQWSSVVAAEDGIAAVADVRSSFSSPTDSGWHLSVPVTIQMFHSLACLYGGCGIDDPARSSGQLHLSRVSLRCKRPVRVPQGIPMHLSLARESATHERVACTAKAALQAGAFAGSFAFSFPASGWRPAPEHMAADRDREGSLRCPDLDHPFASQQLSPAEFRHAEGGAECLHEVTGAGEHALLPAVLVETAIHDGIIHAHLRAGFSHKACEGVVSYVAASFPRPPASARSIGVTLRAGEPREIRSPRCRMTEYEFDIGEGMARGSFVLALMPPVTA